MTWRAFIIGLLMVAGLCLITPYNDLALANTYLTGNHFPVGAFFLLVVLTLIVNVCLKLIRRVRPLNRPELMLIWCMMIIGATVPSSGLMRYFFPMVASPPYYAERQDYHWEEAGHLLSEAPEQLVLSKDTNSPAAVAFFQGPAPGEKYRIPWKEWRVPLLTWGIFLMLFYLATFFACALFRGRWVDSERLIFPVARVPLELTEHSGGRSLVPPLVADKFFLLGAGLSLVFGVLRISPLVPETTINFGILLRGSWLSHGYFGWTGIYPIAIGFAFLIPAEISFSFWFVWLLTRFEFLSAYGVGLPLKGGRFGEFLQWQEAGAFIAFTAVLFWQARHHIYNVARKAAGFGKGIDDTPEPISYALTFWGLLLCLGGLVAWFWYFQMSPLIAVLLLAMVFSILLVHARLVSQGGLFFTQQIWSPPQILHGISGGHAFSVPAVVAAQMQHAILISDAREVLGPHAMNALRISSVFERHRRLFLPTMLAALAVALLCAGWSSMHVYHSHGALNIRNPYGVRGLPPMTFEAAERMITRPKASAETHYVAMAFGAGFMFILVALRTVFYWWPIHPLGFPAASTYSMSIMWFPFFLGWCVKVVVVKVAGGRTLRRVRRFFLGVIASEAFLVALCAVLGLIFRKPFAKFVFLPG